MQLADERPRAVAQSQSPPPALAVHDVSKRFGALVALSDLSFSVPDGAVMAVIGPNGAGKSTLFNLITGVIPPDSGEVSLYGTSLAGMPPHERARLGLARTFQAALPFPNMTVQENVMVGMRRQIRASLLGCALVSRAAVREARTMREEAIACLEIAGLRVDPTMSAAVLTAGQQRLLAIARAVATQPRVLLLDEPAAGLNEVERRTLAEAVRRLRARGITILLIEHSMDFVMELADRILVLDYGKRLAEGTPAQIRTAPEVIAAYLGED